MAHAVRRCTGAVLRGARVRAQAHRSGSAPCTAFMGHTPSRVTFARPCAPVLARSLSHAQGTEEEGVPSLEQTIGAVLGGHRPHGARGGGGATDEEGRVESTSVHAFSDANVMRRGDKVSIRVKRFTPVGAVVAVRHPALSSVEFDGIVSRNELTLHMGLRKSQGLRDTSQYLRVGDTMDAYVMRKATESLDISLREVGDARRHATVRMVSELLERSPNHTVHVGDKSSLDQIRRLFPGMSKREFKAALGTLYKRGEIHQPRPYTISMIPHGERQTAADPQHHHQEGEDGRGGLAGAPPMVTIRGMAYETTEEAVVEEMSKYGDVVAIRDMKLADGSGRASGRATVTFAAPSLGDALRDGADGGDVQSQDQQTAAEDPAELAVRHLDKTEAFGRRIRVERYVPPEHRVVSPWVFVGNLPYAATEQAVVDEIEVLTGAGTVVKTNFVIGKGYAHFCMRDAGLAQFVVQELNGVPFMDRTLRVDTVEDKARHQRGGRRRVVQSLLREEQGGRSA